VPSDQFSRNLYRDQAESFAADHGFAAGANAMIRCFERRCSSSAAKLFVYAVYATVNLALIHEIAVVLFTTLESLIHWSLS